MEYSKVQLNLCLVYEELLAVDSGMLYIKTMLADVVWIVYKVLSKHVYMHFR